MDAVKEYLLAMGIQGWFWLGAALCVIGLFLNRNSEKDAFNRRNQYGVEEFDSWEHRQQVRRREGFRRLISFLFIAPGVCIAVVAGIGWLLKNLL